VPAEIDPAARERLLDALASGATVAAASRSAGYARGHVYRLLDDEAFAAELEQRRAAVGSSPASPDEALALGVLREVAQDARAEDRDRVAAARALLGHAAATKKTPKPKTAEAPPVLKVLPPEEGAAAAKAWLEGHS
jgi:hypothetical protein